MEKDLFEIGTRKNYTFPTVRGEITISDLWRLPLKSSKEAIPSLHAVATVLDKEIKGSTTSAEVESLFADTVAPNADLINKFDIVCHIVRVKKAEAEAAAQAQAKAEEKHELLALLAEKDMEERKGLSRQEILDRIAKL